MSLLWKIPVGVFALWLLAFALIRLREWREERRYSVKALMRRAERDGWWGGEEVKPCDKS